MDKELIKEIQVGDVLNRHIGYYDLYIKIRITEVNEHNIKGVLFFYKDTENYSRSYIVNLSESSDDLSEPYDTEKKAILDKIKRHMDGEPLFWDLEGKSTTDSIFNMEQLNLHKDTVTVSLKSEGGFFNYHDFSYNVIYSNKIDAANHLFYSACHFMLELGRKEEEIIEAFNANLKEVLKNGIRQ